VELIATSETEAVVPSPAEWQARVDFAAAHRLAVWHGLSEGIFNHFTLVVPTRPDRYYQIPFGLHWSEVTASCLMEVSYDGQVLSGSGEVEHSAFCIHVPIHRLFPRHACVMHTHMPFASALSRLDEARLAALGQAELAFFDIIAYDDDYSGIALDPTEGERLAAILGPNKKVLLMANHGVLVCAETVAEAYDLLYFFERACQVQLHAMWTGRTLKRLSKRIVARTLQQYRLRSPKLGSESHFSALKRLLDRREPDYAD
jgi:ribulose-5-phosphate 4-epimerase/fuculose-1-phosphate aldolase